MSKYEEYKVEEEHKKPNIEAFSIEQCEEHIKDLYVAINVYTLKLHQITDSVERGLVLTCTQIQMYRELDETYQQLTKLLKEKITCLIKQ